MKATIAIVSLTVLMAHSALGNEIWAHKPVSYTAESYGKRDNLMLVLNGEEIGFRLVDMMCVPDEEVWDKEFNTRIWINNEEIPSVMKCMKVGEAIVVPSVTYKLHVMRTFIENEYVSVEFMIDGHHVYSLNK